MSERITSQSMAKGAPDCSQPDPPKVFHNEEYR